MTYTSLCSPEGAAFTHKAPCMQMEFSGSCNCCSPPLLAQHFSLTLWSFHNLKCWLSSLAPLPPILQVQQGQPGPEAMALRQVFTCLSVCAWRNGQFFLVPTGGFCFNTPESYSM